MPLLTALLRSPLNAIHARSRPYYGLPHDYPTLALLLCSRFRLLCDLCFVVHRPPPYFLALVHLRSGVVFKFMFIPDRDVVG